MILKQNFDPRKVASYIWKEMSAALVLSGGIYVGQTIFSLKAPSLPFGVLSMLGASVAIFLAFRNNASYTRWGEAAGLWANIVNQCRILGRLVNTFVDSHKHTPQYQKEAAEAFKQELVKRLIAWPQALCIQLRKTDEKELQKFLTESDFARVSETNNKPLALLHLIGKQIYDGMAKGILQGFDSFQLEGAMAQLSSLQTSCERLKMIPVPRQYDYFTRLFVQIFIALTPFGLIPLLNNNDLWLIVPLSLIITFIFTVIERTGEINEAPFENLITDVPMTTMCKIIESDLLEILGEKHPPFQPQPQDGYLF